MKTFAITALFASILVGPALADGARLTGMPAELLGGAAAEGTEHTLPKPPALSVQAGAVTVALDKTTIDDVETAFGGKVQRAADGAVSVAWLCYGVAANGTNQNIWFVSNRAAGSGSHPVTLVGSIEADPRPDCPAPTGTLTGLAFPSPVPTIGADVSALKTAFGAVNARNGMVAYIHQSASAGGTLLNSLNYLIKHDRIVGVAATVIGAP